MEPHAEQFEAPLIVAMPTAFIDPFAELPFPAPEEVDNAGFGGRGGLGGRGEPGGGFDEGRP